MFATKETLSSWRKMPVVMRIEAPSRLDRAHSVGYKAKQGYILVRARLGKGSSKRERPNRGRKPSKMGQTRYSPKQSQKWICEQRAAKRFTNTEVLNSYYVGEDGRHVWYEVVLVERTIPNAKKILGSNPRGRVYRGLTSAGRRGRGR